MEYCKGGNLASRTLKEGYVDEQEIAKGFGNIVKALISLHSKNIMHRDIKPENLMFGGPEGDIIKLVDFGFAIQANKTS